MWPDRKVDRGVRPRSHQVRFTTSWKAKCVGKEERDDGNLVQGVGLLEMQEVDELRYLAVKSTGWL